MFIDGFGGSKFYLWSVMEEGNISLLIAIQEGN